MPINFLNSVQANSNEFGKNSWLTPLEMIVNCLIWICLIGYALICLSALLISILPQTSTIPNITLGIGAFVYFLSFIGGVAAITYLNLRN
jgi:hypothetical protein